MADENPAATPDPAAWPAYAWQRWMRRWPWFFYGALLLGVGAWWTDQAARRSPLLPVAGLVLGLIAWERLWAATLAHSGRRARRGAVPLLAAVALGLSVAATQLSLAFWFVGLVLLVLFYVVLPLPWAILSSAILTAHAGWVQRAATGAAGLAPAELAAFLLSRTVVATLLGLFVRSVVRQSERRHRLADELERARGDLAAAERMAGTVEERQRVAREIHDTLTQDLSAIVMHLETAEQLLPPAASGARAQLERARAVARSSLEETRRVVAALRPEILEHAELPEALARVTAQWSARVGIPATPAVAGVATPLHPEADVTLLRAAQEALANVHRHAQARAVTVTLTYLEDQVALDIRDDGIGFDAAAAPARADGGFGLRAMRERVEALAGTLSLESEPGEGTTVSVSLPLFRTAELPAARRAAP